MDLQNLENYPVYILNVIPELTEESNVQLPQQINSGELMSYNFYVPNVDHQVPTVSTECIPPIVSHTNSTKSIQKISYDKTIHHSAIKNDQSTEPHIITYSDKFVKDVSLLLKDEDMLNDDNKVLKYDSTTDTNVIVQSNKLPSKTEICFNIKKVKYNVKSDFVCGGCGKTYLGHKRMQEHLERFPSHKMNTANKQVDSELQNIFQNLHETPMNIDIINSKKEIHTQTEIVKNRHCAYIRSKKNLQLHLKQIIKHLKKTNLMKSLSGTISVWDLLSSTLESGGLQAFSKELNTLIINLRSLSKSFKIVSNCESNSIDNNHIFIDDSLGHLMGLPKGSYTLRDIQNDYEMEPESSVWTMDSTKSIEPKVTPQNLNCHSSPIHLNIFDSQSSKVDFLLSSSMEESILCDENQAVLESVDGLVSERLRSMSDHLHTNVPIIDYPIASTSSATNVSQSDSFMGHGVYEVFTNELNLVPTSTEEFIKSLEQFEPLNDTDSALSTETRMLDFEDLQHTFHTS
ncbi:PREDICTED: uncharacterized protein LOC107163681 [Diuraphis noxia]|uniref:uncharacterized protein LOC107163681 n=1 Tax=Diuraphis noxia TaxID=143948 RepID=UPI000763AF0E|nr:PREDICTED: uncharacterized protein LOC107163681 [Diuraphis noxia]